MQKYWVTVDDKGNTRWYKDANCTVFHRVGGPAIECVDGYQMWYLDGEIHRTDGPAIEYPGGSKMWFLGGLLHRTDGAAIEFFNGSKQWFLNGKRISQEEHLRRTNPAQEMTVAEIEKLLGKRIKIIK